MNLDEATQKVARMAENNGGKVNAIINFKFDEGVIHLDDTVTPTVVSNEEKNAACTIKMSLSNFEKLMSGNLNPMMAFMAGKMKIDGDKGVAMKLASLF
ncbi:SCP2 sterol-binding domain-containing protein [Marinoscillum sp.]|uniref:SCP2 sterol-binding domain-containing protein n=1 Tax=Marinoscillum sp. TaxID=2024838 RepID=UPI003BAAFD76